MIQQIFKFLTSISDGPQHLSSSKYQDTSFGLLVFMYALASASFGGDCFLVAELIIEMMLMHTELVFKAGVQSVERVLRQIYPQE